MSRHRSLQSRLMRLEALLRSGVASRTRTAIATAPAPSVSPPDNRFSVVQDIAVETGYPDSGMDVTNFTQLVAERLFAEDSNWGRRLNDSGIIGKDTVAYRVLDNDNNPFSIDIVAGATTPNPVIQWAETGRVGGSWLTP